MIEPVWLDLQIILDIHAEQLALFGGADGLREQGLLESALNRPINQAGYGGDADLASLAAAHAFGIVRNHPFIDGNKRAAFAALIVFLGLNDVAFIVPPPEATAIILALAASEVSEEALTQWIRNHWPETAGS